MLFIYSPHTSPRLDFVLDFAFSGSLNLPYTVTDRADAIPADTVFLNYSDAPMERRSLWIPPDPLLFGRGAERGELQRVRPVRYGGSPRLFPVERPGAALPYEPLATIFLMLSRYEEYLPFAPDAHGRFPAAASLAVQHNFIHLPVADLAVRDLGRIIGESLPEFEAHIKSRLAETGYALSYDVDEPFAWHGKSAWRNLGGGLRDLFAKGRGKRLAWTLNTGKDKPDPYDIFRTLLDDLDEQMLKARFFLLLQQGGPNNPAPDWRDARFQKLVLELSERQSCGLHPSYDCRTPQALQTEIDRYKELTGGPPEHARLHFLRLKLPDSYRLLLDAGIRHDHSMAFPDHYGFRAGTSRSFRFYDLERESVTDLRVHPFAWMDATYEYYLKPSDNERITEHFDKLSESIDRTGGTVSAVFHNDLISGNRSGRHWPVIHADILHRFTRLRAGPRQD